MPPGVPATSFVGRRSELAALSRLLRSTRMLTIVGPGGAGKTRLAAAAVARLRSPTVRWVDLAPLREWADVTAAVERAIGVRGDGTLSEPAIATTLRDRHHVIVLDNCEHLPDASRTVAMRLLASARSARVIATSRAPLHIADEVTWRVPPMSVPDDARGPQRADAVRLFVERARSSDPRFSLDRETAAAVSEICRRLEGHPLAIELAAARLRHIPLLSLAQRIGEVTTLAASAADVERHRSMSSALDWSHDLLDDPARRLFRRVSLFPSGFTLDAAETVSMHDTPDVPAVIAQLVDASLVEFASVDGRYRMLEPIREYAEDRLRRAGEHAVTLDRTARYLVDLVTGSLGPERKLPHTDHRVRAEFGNVMGVMPTLVGTDPAAALDVLMSYAGRHRTAVPVHLSVVSGWFARAIAARPDRDARRARALSSWARTIWAFNRSDGAIEMARRFSTEALEISTEARDRDGEEQARFTLAIIAFRHDDRVRARQLYDELLTTLVDARLAAFAHTGRAVVRHHLGDAGGAGEDLRHAFAAWDRHGDPHVTDRTLTIFSEAEIAFASGDAGSTAAHLRRVIALRRSAGEPQEATPFEFLAHVAAVRGDHERAMRLMGIADRHLDASGSGPIPWYRLADRGWLQVSETKLGRRARELRAEGRRLGPDAGAAYALGERVSSVGLTEREHAVAALVAEGLTDKEIAARLRVSARTAENHVQHVREKLGVRSRAQIAHWVGSQATSAQT